MTLIENSMISVYSRFILFFGIGYLLIIYPISEYFMKNNKKKNYFYIFNLIIVLILLSCSIIILIEFINYGKPIKIKDEILKSMKTIEKKTNNKVKFIPKNDNTDNSVKFVYNSKLSVAGLATLGVNNKNRKNIIKTKGSICNNGNCSNNFIELKSIDLNTIIHEILHTLGIRHEFNRYDRDKFIDIEKIDSASVRKRNVVLDYELNLPYDIYSIMHYNYEINKELKDRYDQKFLNFMDTILLYKLLFQPINTPDVLTDTDIKKIKKIY